MLLLKWFITSFIFVSLPGLTLAQNSWGSGMSFSYAKEKEK